MSHLCRSACTQTWSLFFQLVLEMSTNKQGYPTSLLARRPRLISRLKLCVHVRCFFSNVWGLFRYSHLRVGFILLQCLICSCALHLHVSILKCFVSAYVYAWNFGLSLTLETLVLCHVIVIWLRGESHTFDVTNWKTLKVCGTLWGKKWQRKEELSETSDC